MLIQNPPREGGANYLSINVGLFCGLGDLVRVTFLSHLPKKEGIKQDNKGKSNLVILLII